MGASVDSLAGRRGRLSWPRESSPGRRRGRRGAERGSSAAVCRLRCTARSRPHNAIVWSWSPYLPVRARLETHICTITGHPFALLASGPPAPIISISDGVVVGFFRWVWRAATLSPPPRPPTPPLTPPYHGSYFRRDDHPAHHERAVLSSWWWAACTRPMELIEHFFMAEHRPHET